MEIWTLKQAALLLHGLDPNQHRSLKPYAKDLPPEYADLQKTYLLLHQFPWGDVYRDYYYWSKGIHPIAIIHLAIHQKLPLPKRLKKLVAERFYRENQHDSEEHTMQKTFAPYAPPIKPTPPTVI